MIRGADPWVVQVGEGETAAVARTPVRRPGTDRRGYVRTATVRADHEFRVDLVGVGAVAVADPGRATIPPENLLEGAPLPDLGAGLSRRVHQDHVLLETRDADAVVDAVHRGEALPYPDIADDQFQVTHYGGIQLECLGQRAHPPQFRDTVRDQHVGGETVGREPGLVDQHHLPAGAGQRDGRRGSRHPCPDDDDINPLGTGTRPARELRFPRPLALPPARRRLGDGLVLPGVFLRQPVSTEILFDGHLRSFSAVDGLQVLVGGKNLRTELSGLDAAQHLGVEPLARRAASDELENHAGAERTASYLERRSDLRADGELLNEAQL